MSQIIDQAEALRQQAIGLLIAERQIIDQKLAMLGADGTESPVRKGKVCGLCSSPDHNARTCPQKKGTPVSAPTPTT
jgi:hypothetical protein